MSGHVHLWIPVSTERAEIRIKCLRCTAAGSRVTLTRESKS